MNEAEWLASTDPRPMLDFLHGKTSERKLRLCGAAYCRAVWSLLQDEHSRQAVELAEQFADGAITEYHLMLARTKAEKVIRQQASETGEWAARAAAYVALPWADSAARGVLTMTPPIVLVESPENAGAMRCQFIRDILGNPFRPVSFDPAWRSRTVLSLASSIYDDRAFDRLPILADALEEASCTSAEIPAHLRSPDPHVRGCWALDLVLGKQ